MNRGVADRGTRRPKRSIRVGSDRINAGGGVGNQLGGKSGNDASPRRHFLRFEQFLKKRSYTTARILAGIGQRSTSSAPTRRQRTPTCFLAFSARVNYFVRAL